MALIHLERRDTYGSQSTLVQYLKIEMIQSDHSTVTGRQVAAARALLGLGQAELASAASISVPTLKRMEASQGSATGMANNVRAVISALEAAGVEFTNGGEPGVKLRRKDPV